MVKTSTLIVNEFKKIFARKLFIVLTAILLTIGLIISVAMSLINLLDYDYSIDDEILYLNEAIVNMESDSEYVYYDTFFYDDDYFSSDLPLLEAKEKLRLYQTAKDIGIENTGDWRYGDYFAGVISTAYQRVLYDQVKNHGECEKLALRYIDEYQYTISEIADCVEQSDALIEYYRTITFYDYIKDYRDSYAACKPQKPTVITEAAELTYDLECEMYESAVAAYDYIISNHLDYGDPLTSEALNIVNYCSYGGYQVLDEETYNKSPQPKNDGWISMGDMTYEEYMNKVKNETLPGIRTKLKIGQYCLDNKVYDVAASGEARTAANNFTLMFDLLVYLAIVMYSTVMATEFTSKTINLLAIRPISRTKLIMSKYLTLLITSSVIFTFAFLLHIIITALITGGTDLMQPAFVTLCGNLVAVPFAVHLIFNYICCFVSATMLATIAFFFATSARNNIAGILIAIGIDTVAGSIPLLISVLFGSSAAMYVPLSYIEMWGTVDVGLSCSNGSFSIGLTSLGYSYNNYYGLLVCAVIAVLCLAFSVINFKRRDIK